MVTRHPSRIFIIILLVMTVFHMVGCGHRNYGRSFTTRRIVLVVIDGVRHTEFFSDSSHSYCPWIWNELRPDAFISHAMHNNGLTRTFPGHASLFSGRYQFLPNDGSRRPYQPMIWEYIRNRNDSADSLMVLATVKGKLRHLSYSTQSEYGARDSVVVIGPYTDDTECVSEFFQYAEQYAPVVSMVCLGTVDIIGHSGDWDAYLSAVWTADSLTVEVWRWIQQTDGFAGVTSMFVTADHGRHDDIWDNHGCHCEGCRRLPFLAIGPEIKTGVELRSPEMEIIDIVQTAAVMLGVDMPFAEGRVLTELFDDTVPPCAPELRYHIDEDGIVLKWKPVVRDREGSPEAVLSYKIYRDTLQTPSATVRTSSFRDTSAYAADKPRSYRVRAVDIGGNESEPSNTVTVHEP